MEPSTAIAILATSPITIDLAQNHFLLPKFGTKSLFGAKIEPTTGGVPKFGTKSLFGTKF